MSPADQLVDSCGEAVTLPGIASGGGESDDDCSGSSDGDALQEASPLRRGSRACTEAPKSRPSIVDIYRRPPPKPLSLQKPLPDCVTQRVPDTRRHSTSTAGQARQVDEDVAGRRANHVPPGTEEKSRQRRKSMGNAPVASAEEAASPQRPVNSRTATLEDVLKAGDRTTSSSVGEWMSKLLSCQDMMDQQRESGKVMLAVISEFLPEALDLSTTASIRLREHLEGEVKKVQTLLAKKSFDVVVQDMEELAGLRVSHASHEEKLTRMSRTYFQEITATRDKSRSIPEAAQKALDAVDGKGDAEKQVRYYEPLHYLSAEVQHLCMAIVDEKLKAVLAEDSSLVVNSTELTEMKAVEVEVLADKLVSCEKLNQQLREEVRSLQLKLKKENTAAEKTQFALAIAQAPKEHEKALSSTKILELEAALAEANSKLSGQCEELQVRQAKIEALEKQLQGQKAVDGGAGGEEQSASRAAVAEKHDVGVQVKMQMGPTAEQAAKVREILSQEGSVETASAPNVFRKASTAEIPPPEKQEEKPPEEKPPEEKPPEEKPRPEDAEKCRRLEEELEAATAARETAKTDADKAKEDLRGAQLRVDALTQEVGQSKKIIQDLEFSNMRLQDALCEEFAQRDHNMALSEDTDSMDDLARFVSEADGDEAGSFELRRVKGALRLVVAKNKDLQEALFAARELQLATPSTSRATPATPAFDEVGNTSAKTLTSAKGRAEALVQSQEVIRLKDQRARLHDQLAVSKAQVQELDRLCEVRRVALEDRSQELVTLARELRKFVPDTEMPLQLDAVLAKVESSGRAKISRLQQDARLRKIADTCRPGASVAPAEFEAPLSPISPVGDLHVLSENSPPETAPVRNASRHPTNESTVSLSPVRPPRGTARSRTYTSMEGGLQPDLSKFTPVGVCETPLNQPEVVRKTTRSMSRTEAPVLPAVLRSQKRTTSNAGSVCGGDLTVQTPRLARKGDRSDTLDTVGSLAIGSKGFGVVGGGSPRK